MTIFYSNSKSGFFSSEIHASIPEDGVEISPELHGELMTKQSDGKVIVLGADGLPTTIDPQDPTTDDLIARCKVYAGRLLVATDWAMMPDANLVNKEAFADYRRKVRALRINPVTNPTWPQLPKPKWPKE
jgi:hypothetical protein